MQMSNACLQLPRFAQTATQPRPYRQGIKPHIMVRNKTLLPLFIVTLAFLSSCAQNKTSDAPKQTTAPTTQETYQEPHQYGGWYCPDNFGFEPIDIQELRHLAVVSHRLPTREETQNGTSLIYIDTVKHPDAHALDINLPRVARIYSEHNGLNELIIVIQAVVIGNDSVVGYRFPNGGNGSAWLKQITFLSDKEVVALGPSPMVYQHATIKASKAAIWKAITRTDYAKQLGNRFNQQVFFLSDWKDDSELRLKDDSQGAKAIGSVSTFWGNLYLQIDYDYSGFHYSEKMLVYENTENNTSELHFAAGPFPNDFALQNHAWQQWLEQVKRLSEKK